MTRVALGEAAAGGSVDSRTTMRGSSVAPVRAPRTNKLVSIARRGRVDNRRVTLCAVAAVEVARVRDCQGVWDSSTPTMMVTVEGGDGAPKSQV